MVSKCSRLMKLKSTPSCSPARGAREVNDRDRSRSGTVWTSRSTSVVLPVPDGAETTKTCPRLSLDILDLLPHLLEFGFRGHDEFRNRLAVGLRADGVDLAVHFLQQEIQLA